MDLRSETVLRDKVEAAWDELRAHVGQVPTFVARQPGVVVDATGITTPNTVYPDIESLKQRRDIIRRLVLLLAEADRVSGYARQVERQWELIQASRNDPGLPEADTAMALQHYRVIRDERTRAKEFDTGEPLPPFLTLREVQRVREIRYAIEHGLASPSMDSFMPCIRYLLSDQGDGPLSHVQNFMYQQVRHEEYVESTDETLMWFLQNSKVSNSMHEQVLRDYYRAHVNEDYLMYMTDSKDYDLDEDQRSEGSEVDEPPEPPALTWGMVAPIPGWHQSSEEAKVEGLGPPAPKPDARSTASSEVGVVTTVRLPSPYQCNSMGEAVNVAWRELCDLLITQPTIDVGHETHPSNLSNEAAFSSEMRTFSAKYYNRQRKLLLALARIDAEVGYFALLRELLAMVKEAKERKPRAPAWEIDALITRYRTARTAARKTRKIVLELQNPFIMPGDAALLGRLRYACDDTHRAVSSKREQIGWTELRQIIDFLISYKPHGSGVGVAIDFMRRQKGDHEFSLRPTRAAAVDLQEHDRFLRPATPDPPETYFTYTWPPRDPVGDPDTPHSGPPSPLPDDPKRLAPDVPY